MAAKVSNYNYHQIPQIVADHPKMNGDGERLFRFIYQILRDSPYAFHRNKTLARHLKRSERYVVRLLNFLESLGIIEREGLSFNRRIKLGKLFTTTKSFYTKIKRKVKNLSRRARNQVNTGLSGVHNKETLNYIKNNKKGFTYDDLTMYNYYKDNPQVPIPEKHQHLFE